jgi:uncharacterized membrane protein YadS
MRFHYGLYLLLAVVSLLAVIFDELRAWGALGLIPLIFSVLSGWMVSIVFKLEQDFDRGVVTGAAVIFALCAIVTFGWLLIHAP